MMGFWQRLRERYQSAKLEAEVKFGRKQWGRQTKGRASISAVVIRADGTREDLGVIADGLSVEFRPGVENGNGPH